MKDQVKNNPLVSVVIPCYNHELFVQEAIQSIINQNYRNIELIIIDDGSQDNSVEKIKCMTSASRERFARFEFRHRDNKGLCATLNEALKWCSGKYFFALASDDVAMPHKINFQVNELAKISNKKVVGIFSKIMPFANKLPSFNSIEKSYSAVRLYDFSDILLRKSRLPAPSALLCLNSVMEVGGYDENLKIEDLYMWLKLTNNGGKLAYVDEVVTLYRRHEKNTSKKSELMLIGVMEVLQSYSGHPKYPEAIARTFLVHAGDLIEEKSLSGFIFLIKALKKCPQLVFSKLFVTFFYRAINGLCARYK